MVDVARREDLMIEKIGELAKHRDDTLAWLGLLIEADPEFAPIYRFLIEQLEGP